MLSKLKITGKSPLTTFYAEPKNITYFTGDVINPTGIIKKESTTLSTAKGQKSAVLVDFGSELVGGIAISGYGTNNSGKTAFKFKVNFGESATEAITANGVKGTTNDHSVIESEIDVSLYNGTSFGKTAFRFVYLELLSENSTYTITNLKAECTLRDIPYLGSFSCDDDTLTNIYNTSAYTLHLCMQEKLWDGVKRDRLVWIGDTHPEMLTLRSVFGDNKIIDETLIYIKNTNKLPNFPNNITTYGMWYILILYDWFEYTGREDIIYSVKDYFEGLLEQLLSLIHFENQDFLNEEEFKFGFFLDWPSKDTAGAKAGVISLFVLTLNAAAKICKKIGNQQLLNNTLKAIDYLKTAKLNHNNQKQIAAFMNLAGLLDDKTAKEILIKDNSHGFSTFMSYYILKSVLKTADMETALKLLDEYYGAMLKVGATTFWEDFDINWFREDATIEKVLNKGEYDIHGDNGKYCYQNFRHSLCHGWSSGPAAFIAEEVLGIKILKPGCKEVSVKPNLGHLNWIKGTYPTPYGIIKVKAEKINSEVKLNVTAPNGVKIIY